MSDVKRWGLKIIEHEKGDFVLASDYDALKAQNAELAAALLIARTYVASSGENGSALAMNTIDAALSKVQP